MKDMATTLDITSTEHSCSHLQPDTAKLAGLHSPHLSQIPTESYQCVFMSNTALNRPGVPLVNARKACSVSAKS